MEYIIDAYPKQQLEIITDNTVKYHIVGKHVTVSYMYDHMMIRFFRFERGTCSAYLVDVCVLLV